VDLEELIWYTHIVLIIQWVICSLQYVKRLTNFLEASFQCLLYSFNKLADCTVL